MERRSKTWIALLVILLVAAALRLYGIEWDGGIGAHPDERYVVDVADRLAWPGGLDPFEAAPDYAYGHLPLYLLAAARILARGGDPTIPGRVLAGLIDTGTVAVTFALARQVFDRRVGLVAAGFVSLAVLHVQQAHFYTVDVLLGFFTAGALLFAVHLAESGMLADAWLAGVWAGLALATKASAVLLAVPLGAACSLVCGNRRGCAWRVCLSAIAAFALASPFALVNLPVYARNVGRQSAIVRGTLVVPYTLQYRGTLPYIYPVVQQLRWGVGWVAGIAAIGGAALAVWRAVRRPPRAGEWVILAWALPSFALLGALHAKFPRYLLPLTPLLGIFAAALVVRLTKQNRWLLHSGCAALLGPMLLRCLFLVSSYRSPHPWVAASDWLYGNVDPGMTIATEEWDHPLPLDATAYAIRELPVFEAETPAKWAEMDAILEEADYVVIASRRGYATLGGLSDLYPRTARFYEGLFEGDLRFEPVACFSRFPSLVHVALVDDPTAGLAFDLPELCRIDGYRIPVGPLDESFVVYDRPQVLVFKAVD